MSELNLYEETIQEATIAYGNESLIDYSSIGESDDEVWNRRNRLPQKPRKVSKDAYSLTAVSQEGSQVLIRPWTEKEDPFTQVDLLDSEEDAAQEIIYRIKTTLSVPYRERLANRLLTLVNDAKEADPSSSGITVGSLRSFYNFFQSHPNLKYPAISLMPEDNIYASWRSEQNRLFSVHFLPNGDTRFVIFKPNERHPDKQMRISGTATTDILMETVTPYGVWDWISE
ncbi:MAG: hypothetical protein NUV74_16115 [Candidatus Brocadiaceae bacterium]|nr:hypothetical protein [Candidatus Brocadiaceae bacterium]